VTQPLDRTCEIEPQGKIDIEAGELWVNNPFQLMSKRENLSAFEANRFFLNLGGRAFVDLSVESATGIDSDSRSSMVADFNADGKPDLLVGSVGGGPLRLFLNQIPASTNRLYIKLLGTSSNKTAIGSRITAACGERRFVRDYFSANGFMGQSPAGLHLGVGQATTIDQLIVRWPNGNQQVLDNVPASGRITITEGQDGFE